MRKNILTHRDTLDPKGTGGRKATVKKTERNQHLIEKGQARKDKCLNPKLNLNNPKLNSYQIKKGTEIKWTIIKYW